MKNAPASPRSIRSAAIVPTLWVMVGCFGLAAFVSLQAQPGWWGPQGQGAVLTPQVVTNGTTVTTNYVRNDYAVANQGQLKRFTVAAVNQLNATLTNSGGAGPTLSNLVYNWHQDYLTNGYATNTASASYPYKPSDRQAVNVGQLKFIGNKIWSRLVAIGYTNAVPSWLAQNTATDGVVANLGQLKEIFDFDLALDADGNGLPDWWEIEYFGQTGNGALSSPDGNGLTLLQDYQQGNDPTNYYSQNGQIIPVTLAIADGNNQIESTRTFVPHALSVTAKNSANSPLVNAPVTFLVTGSSDGLLATSLGGTGSTSLTVTTSSSGVAQVYYAGGSVANSTSSIQVTAAASSVTFNETTYQDDGAVAAPSGITQSAGSFSGQVVLNWTNHATNATYIIVQHSIDNVNWTTVAQINDPTVTTYTFTEANPQQSYYYGVIAGKP